MKRWIPCLALLLAACGKPADHPTCAADEACAVGQVCERPVAGEDGICAAPYALAVTEPAAGSWIRGSTAVAATLELLAPTRALPAAVDLLVDGQAVAVLARDGASGTYRGSWTPQAGTVAAVALRVVAQRGTRAEQVSAARSVNVDRVQPAIASVSMGCTPDCKRDGTLRLQARVTEPNPAAVTATLDLDASRVVALARQGTTDLYEAQVPLSGYAFPSFERSVQVSVRAVDQAGNEAAGTAMAKVTRLRWAYAVGAPVTSPAVMGDGTLVVGVSATSEQVRAVNPDGSEAWRLTVGPAFIIAAPSAGSTAMWVGSEDGRVYAATSSGIAIRYPTVDPLAAAALFTPAMGNGDTAYAAGAARRAYAVRSDGSVGAANNTTDAVTAAMAVGGGGAVLAATATATATATLRRFSDPGDGVLTQDWAVTPADAGVECTRIDAPPAIDASGKALVACGNGQLFSISPAGVASLLVKLTGKADASILVRSDGDLVLGTNDNLLHRLTPGTAPSFVEKWSPLDLGAAVSGVALASRDASGVDVYAVTAEGRLAAVDGDTAAVVWSTSGVTPPPLGLASLDFPVIAPARGGGLPTLYAGSADGHLYAVVVDGGLDTSAPWPKAHHDVRNSGNAGSPLP